MIVELAGLPGSGKSTLARLLEADSRMRRIVVKPWTAAQAARRPGAAFHSFIGNRVFRPGNGWSIWASLCALRLAQDELTRQEGADLLFEEGIVHHVWRSIFIQPKLAQRDWQALIGSDIPLLVLEAEPATRHTRIIGKKRRGPVNDALAAASPGDALWRRAGARFEDVLAETRRRPVVLRVSTEGTPEVVVQRIQEALRTFATPTH